ncbi:unnamed protein product [Pleuronectes platessa]|uniref:Uncharacterized protein n=1 Tax=Pleuronectes platessa TaxID=8262 RepID=A0A9N7V445_PLEPL|nr:unnamed protein product [Pleuronectes platessa]
METQHPAGGSLRTSHGKKLQQTVRSQKTKKDVRNGLLPTCTQWASAQDVRNGLLRTSCSGDTQTRFEGTRLALGGPRSLQKGLVSGSDGPQLVLYRAGSGPPHLQSLAATEEGSTAEAGPLTALSTCSSRMLRAGGSQLMSLCSSTSVVLSAASAPAPAPVAAPRRRLPADVSLFFDVSDPHSGVCSHLSSCAAPRRRLSADVLCVSASEILAVPAPHPAPSLCLLRAGGSRLTSSVFRRRRSSRCQLRTQLRPSCLLRAGGSRLTSSVFGVGDPCGASSAPTSSPFSAAEVLASPAPVPVPRRRLPADVSPLRADVPPVLESEVPADSAAVPVPHRRAPAEVPPVQASEVLAAPIMGSVLAATPDPAPRPWLRSAPFCAAPERPRRRPPGELSCLAPDRPPGRPAEPQNSVPERPRRRLPEELPCLAPDRPPGRPAEPLNSVPERPRRCPHEPQNSALVRPRRRPPEPLRSAPKRPRSRRVETMYFVPDRPPGRPPEEPPCCVPVRPRGRPPETLCQVPKRPRSRRSENLGTSRSPSSGSPLLPPDSVLVMDRLESGP